MIPAGHDCTLQLRADLCLSTWLTTFSHESCLVIQNGTSSKQTAINHAATDGVRNFVNDPIASVSGQYVFAVDQCC